VKRCGGLICSFVGDGMKLFSTIRNPWLFERRGLCEDLKFRCWMLDYFGDFSLFILSLRHIMYGESIVALFVFSFKDLNQVCRTMCIFDR